MNAPFQSVTQVKGECGLLLLWQLPLQQLDQHVARVSDLGSVHDGEFAAMPAVAPSSLLLLHDSFRHAYFQLDLSFIRWRTSTNRTPTLRAWQWGEGLVTRWLDLALAEHAPQV